MTPTRLARPIAAVRQAGGPCPIEYLALFLVVVAGVLALIR
jgi:hypothetical protein